MIIITKDSDFKSIKKEVVVLKQDLDNIKNKFVAAMKEINNSAGSVDFSSWNDDIQKELDNYLNDDFKNGCDKISTDLESGNFVNLYNSVTNLITELGFCIDCKERIDKTETALTNTPAQVDVQDPYQQTNIYGEYQPNYVDNPAYTGLKKELSGYKIELDGYVVNCNRFLNNIASITFIGTFDSVGVNDSNMNNSLPSSVYNEIPDNLSEDYHPDILIDYEHGVDLAQNFLTRFLRLFTNYPVSEKGLHFVYNEADGCYYEINQDLNNANNVCLYDSIPAGESPGDYGYKPFSIKDINKMSVLNR